MSAGLERHCQQSPSSGRSPQLFSRGSYAPFLLIKYELSYVGGSLTLVSGLLALVGVAVAVVGDPGSLVLRSLTRVRRPVAGIRDSLSVVGETVSLVRALVPANLCVCFPVG